MLLIFDIFVAVASLESHSSLMDQGSHRSKLEGLEASSASSSADKLTSNSANVSDTDAVGARPGAYPFCFFRGDLLFFGFDATSVLLYSVGIE